ncbi:glucuronate isomerase [Aeoliella mucimassa]|uniref:Glucuronate isomerase n=1 Tax=Aeoliella mucimassa TaxID=2527972 RepID=A0A518AJ91_9BACT|nr:glucuronate isomerase [Aeoliella mucimassa]QDU54792.1 hypothetical protein Pan181_09750 [Aeoliella mucimassa]
MSSATLPATACELRNSVQRIVNETPVWDLHTHLYPPTFGTPLAGTGRQAADPRGLMLWGIDELLTYHYLVAEVFRVVPSRRFAYKDFWNLSKQEQADHIWKHLFLERSPVSEACRGVLTTLKMLGLDPAERDLNVHRAWFAEQNADEHINRVMEVSGVSRITMTNDVFDDNERERWLSDGSLGTDSRFVPVLRFDKLLCDWQAAAKQLAGWGFSVGLTINQKTIAGVRRFLEEWIDRTGAVYCAVSLPPTYYYSGSDDPDPGNIIFRQAVLPLLAERNLPMAMMIGVTRATNPRLKVAGDSVGQADVSSVAQLCADFPNNRFLVTLLSRENQHELAVTARKFDNLMPFGCWWFLNNPSLIEEITRMRMELLGTSFAPQHSDARVLEQLVYKWSHSRTIIANVLADKYADLATAGWPVSEDEVRRDAKLLLHDNFADFVAGK